MKKIYQITLRTMMLLVATVLFIAGNNAIAQSNIGVYPNIDAGYESAATGNLSSTQSATGWSYTLNGNSQVRLITATGGYGGPKYLSVGKSAVTLPFTNSTTTVNSNQVTSGTFTAATKYIVQFHYKANQGTPDPVSYVFISADGTSATRDTAHITLGAPASWTKYSTVVTTSAVNTQTTTGTYGIQIKATNTSTNTVADLDNFVVYPADNQSAPAPDVTAPDPATGLSGTPSPALISLTWNAPGTGVDGGGYIVVRYTADPSAEPDPLANAVYKANTANTIGATGVVVYTGTATSFNDGTGNTGTNYWYRVYSVDKAFNYSTPITTGPLAALPKTAYYYSGTGATDNVGNWWTNKNATGSNPANFTDPGQVFHIITNANLLSTLSISGIGSSIIIGEPGSGVAAVTVDFNSTTLPGIDTVYQSSDGNPTILNFNTSSVPAINQLLDIFTQAHYRATGITTSTSKNFDKIFVENNGSVIFTGTPSVTTSFQVEAGSSATAGTLSSRWIEIKAGGTATINGKFQTPKLVGLVSNNMGLPASTGGAIQFDGSGDVVLGPNSTIQYSGISTTTTQNITPRTDYVNMILDSTGVSKSFTGVTTISGTLTLNMTGATGALVLGGAVTVNGGLNLNNGKITTDPTNVLILGPAVTVTGGNNNSFVNGPVEWKTASTNSYLVPVGKGGYRPFTVNPVSATPSTYMAEYFNTPYTDVTNVTAPLTGVSNLEYWNMIKVSGADATVSLSLVGVAVPGALNTDELVVANYVSTSWVTTGGTPINPGDATGGTAVSSGQSFGNSVFTFGIKPSSIVVPLQLLSFDGVKQQSVVSLRWTTTNEINTADYAVELSTDGIHFNQVGLVTANNRAGVNQYHFDVNAISGNVYFRIKMVDQDGRFSYSNIICFKSLMAHSLTVLNNPVTGHQLHIQLYNLNKGNYHLNLTDLQGRLLQSELINIAGGTELKNININPSVSKGLYVLTLVNGADTEQIKIVIQ